MMQTTTRLKVTALNEHLLCVLCGGYLVDATTITECLHSFCKSCIVRYMEAHKTCPRCDVLVHKTKPLLNLRPDRTLQTLVYKLVPGLFQNEKRKRREFYATRPDAVPISGADSGDIEESHLIYTEDEKISLCLQHCDRLPALKYRAGANSLAVQTGEKQERDKRYLLCPALVTIACLKKFIQLKFDLPTNLQVEIFHSDVTLKDACTLMDVANIYSWKRTKPMMLQYIVFDKTQLSLELPDPIDAPIDTSEHTAKKRKRKRNSSGKSPKGLVKSRVFKPPKQRARGVKSRKIAGSGNEGKKSPGANEEDNKQGAESTSDDCVVISTEPGYSVKGDANVSTRVPGDKDSSVNGETETGGNKTTPASPSIAGSVHDTSGDRFEVVMDTVSEENTISVLPLSGSQSEGDTVETDPKPESKGEPPHTIVKIRLNSCNSKGKMGPEVVLKGKNKRSPKSHDKSRLSTKKKKVPTATLR